MYMIITSEPEYGAFSSSASYICCEYQKKNREKKRRRKYAFWHRHEPANNVRSKVLFVASLLTLLSQCIDFTNIRHRKHLSEILIPQCTKNMWPIWNLSLWLCSFYFIWKSIQWILDIPRLLHIRDFYIYLLEIPDEDMQTVSWQDVVSRITTLRDQNVKTATNITPSQRRFISKQLGQVASQSKERLDAHDIANRLMRRENYIIALFNKDILNLTAPIPFLRDRQLFSKSLEWTVQFGVLDLIFNESGQVHQRVLRSDHRGHLSKEMKTRFAFAAFMNLIFAPFLACGLLIDFIFTYYNVGLSWPNVHVQYLSMV